MSQLPYELERERQKICKIAMDCGLDFFETLFEIVDYEQIHQIAAHGGFPLRYPHWRFGMEYDRLSKGYQYGLSKIYEMVINTNPCIAYLMSGNTLMDQKLVMAHVYAHCDFFKNNEWFSKTNRKMIDAMANHAVRVRRYIERYGLKEVESFIDKCLSLENLIDPYRMYQPFQKDREKTNTEENTRTSDFHKAFPFQRDILGFLMHHAPLKEWEQDILSILREEAYYFLPQGMTKTMNEGWASYWHTKMMTECILEDSEVISYADQHSNVVAMGTNNYNPYKVGIELFRDIEDRWNKGKFGPEWENCTDIREKQNWDKKLQLGKEKIFQIRKIYNDVTFIDTFLTEDFCVRQKLFVYKYNAGTKTFELDTRNFKAIKSKLLFLMTNRGQPIMGVIDSNDQNKGALLLAHKHEGVDLQPDQMGESIKNLYALWKRPIHLQTQMDEKPLVICYDGEKISGL